MLPFSEQQLISQIERIVDQIVASENSEAIVSEPRRAVRQSQPQQQSVPQGQRGQSDGASVRSKPPAQKEVSVESPPSEQQAKPLTQEVATASHTPNSTHAATIHKTAKKVAPQSLRQQRSIEMTTEDRVMFDQIKRKKSQNIKPPSLLLNLFDFAGQQTYRPMHHCFITRRAVYIVVFKIPDMLEYMKDPQETKYDPISEVRYWVQSIHAHIHPPDPATEGDPEQEGKPSNVKRVILVGTHRGVQYSDDDLKKIDEKFKEKLIYSRHNTRCMQHIYPIAGHLCKYFIPVENSIDVKKSKERYLAESGTALLQKQIECLTSKLKFMEEDYPITWLKFEKHMHDSQSPVKSLEDIKALAVKSGIAEGKEESVLKFFHNTGKIVYLSELHYNLHS